MKLPRVLPTVILVLVLAVLGSVPAVQAVQQAALVGGGPAYELNRDSLGNLYISDAGAYKFWVINPSSGTYKTYSFGRSVRDAQIDNYNRIWWADGGDTFGYVNPITNGVMQWTLDTAGPYSIQTLYRDNAGGVWLGESDGWRLFHITPNNASYPSSWRLCSFTFGDIGVYTQDMIYQAGYLWVGQSYAGGVYRVSLSGDTVSYKYWDKGYDAGPWGLYWDGSKLWWADYYLSAIVRLDPDQELATFYYLPTGLNPKTMTIDKGIVWYTETANGQVGKFNPSSAYSEDMYLSTIYSNPIDGECSTLTSGSTSTAQTSSGTLSWSESYTSTVYDQNGWKVYEFEGGTIPYGIASAANLLWVNAQGLGQSSLFRFDPQTTVYFPIIRQK